MNTYRLQVSIVVAVLGHLRVVYCLIYPTDPISSTVWTAGQAARVTWIEDGRKPLLSSLGDVKIELWTSNATFISTLARGIDPMSLSTTVFIPPFVPASHRAYTLRFKSAVIPDIIYSADFTVTASALGQARMSATRQRPATQSGSGTSSASPTYPTGPGSRPIGIGTPPVVSRITGSQYLYPSMAPTQPLAPPGSSGFQPPVDGSPAIDTVNQDGSGLNSAATRHSARTPWQRQGRGLDRLGFLAMFILWPALVGFSMAL